MRDEARACETRGSPETRKDFKGLSGLAEDKTPAETP
jgi:hypothetical protein